MAGIPGNTQMALGTGGGVGSAIGTGVAGLLSWLNNNNANSDSMQSLMSALGQAQGAIQTGADKAIGLQQPYTQNAGNDFLRLRDMVQKGYFQTPMQQSFTSQTPVNSGFSFNPSQGTASFNAFQPQGGPATFTPQGLPQMPAPPQSTGWPSTPNGGPQGIPQTMQTRPMPIAQTEFQPGFGQSQSPQGTAINRLNQMNMSPTDAMRQYLQTHIGSGPNAPYNGGQAPQLNMPGPYIPGMPQALQGQPNQQGQQLSQLLQLLQQRPQQGTQYGGMPGGQYGF